MFGFVFFFRVKLNGISLQDFCERRDHITFTACWADALIRSDENALVYTAEPARVKGRAQGPSAGSSPVTF